MCACLETSFSHLYLMLFYKEPKQIMIAPQKLVPMICYCSKHSFVIVPYAEISNDTFETDALPVTCTQVILSRNLFHNSDTI